jgi:putative addiction module CopG family antidote
MICHRGFRGGTLCHPCVFAIVRRGILRTSLNISLTPELERFIAARVASGRYQTASEVVRAALRLLEQNDSREERLSLLDSPRRRRT